LLLPDAELSRPALVLAQRFVQRWDPHARQLDDGSYVCVHEPLNVGRLFAHLRGEITLGAYLLDQESRARFLVLDADDAQAWEGLGHLARSLADENVQAFLENSRRGGHAGSANAQGPRLGIRWRVVPIPRADATRKRARKCVAEGCVN
jgi:hypothetical protein